MSTKNFTHKRITCIKHYETDCCVCGFNFAARLGSAAQGFIHAHDSIKPLSEVQETYEVNPIADLRPVCPNCHAVIHLGGATRSIEAVKAWLKSDKTLPDDLIKKY